MKILGICSGHGATACLVEDGRVVACASEERFRNIKNYIGFPKLAIEWVLRSIHTDRLDNIGLSYRLVNPSLEIREDQKKNIILRVFNIYTPVLWIRNIARFISIYCPQINPVRRFFYNLTFEAAGRISIKKHKRYVSQLCGIDITRIYNNDHHMCHAYAAYYSSPYNKEDALVLTLDAEGDKICATVNTVRDGRFRRIAETPLDRSLGWIYIYVTKYLGMKPNEHEYKVMGLAPYAKEHNVMEVYDKIRNIIYLDPKNPLVFRSAIDTRLSYRFLRKNLEGFRFDNIAGAFQKLTEDLVVEWVKRAIAETGIRTVICGGGVFMNVKVNMKVVNLPEVEKFFAIPSCGDESTPLGSCYIIEERLNGRTQADGINNLYWGPEYSNQYIQEVIKKGNYDTKYKVQYIEDIEVEIAELLSRNKIVARMSGRMEWGARALGNRSILANPSNYDNIRLLNELIKDRDFWMPFAPSIIKEREHDYVVNPKNIPARFMTIAFESTALARQHLVAAIHPYDFTLRPQVVDRDTNPKYYKIIKSFEEKTGIGGVLNTSFNLHGKPIVMGPEQALEVFENSGIEYLALENFLLYKKVYLISSGKK